MGNPYRRRYHALVTANGGTDYSAPPSIFKARSCFRYLTNLRKSGGPEGPLAGFDGTTLLGEAAGSIPRPPVQPLPTVQRIRHVRIAGNCFMEFRQVEKGFQGMTDEVSAACPSFIPANCCKTNQSAGGSVGYR
jgi:hypothetical protein